MGYFDDVKYTKDFLNWINSNCDKLDTDLHWLIRESSDRTPGERKKNVDQLFKFLTEELGMTLDEIVEYDLNDNPAWKSVGDFNLYFHKLEENNDICPTPAGSILPSGSFYNELKTKWLEKSTVTERFLWNIVNGFNNWSYLNIDPDDCYEQNCYGMDEWNTGKLDHLFIGITKEVGKLLKLEKYFTKKVSGKHCVFTGEVRVNALGDDTAFQLYATPVEDEEILYVRIKHFKTVIKRTYLGRLLKLGDIPTMLQGDVVKKYGLPTIGV